MTSWDAAPLALGLVGREIADLDAAKVHRHTDPGIERGALGHGPHNGAAREERQGNAGQQGEARRRRRATGRSSASLAASAPWPCEPAYLRTPGSAVADWASSGQRRFPCIEIGLRFAAPLHRAHRRLNLGHLPRQERRRPRRVR